MRAAGQALVLPGDVPLASAEEIREIAEAAGPSGARRVTLVPDRDDRGTNAILLAPPGIIEPQFGPYSYTQHLNRAVAGRIDVQVLTLPGLALDIDAPADLDELLRRREGSQRYQFLRGGAHKRQGAVAHE